MIYANDFDLQPTLRLSLIKNECYNKQDLLLNNILCLQSLHSYQNCLSR